MSKIIAPKGLKDLFSPEIQKWQFLEEKIREFFSRFLYKEIRTPIFEHSELFQRGIGGETEVVQKEMYTFNDKGGRSLTLRPENTASVVRAAIENNLFEHIFPLRFLYIGPMFRYEKPQKGRFRQFHQFGVEIFGDDSGKLDAEVVFSAYHFLNEIGIQDIELQVNSVGCRVCRPTYLEKLQAAAKEHIDELCTNCQRKVDTNPLRIFDCKKSHCIEISSHFPPITDHLCEECSNHFDEFKETLKIMNVKFVVQPRMVRGLDYYTKTAFEITSSQLGAQNAILGGGRYNNLIKELGGADVPGIGFAAGLERIILHLDHIKPVKEKIFLVAYQNRALCNEAIKLAQSLWRRGLTTYMDYNSGNMKKQFKKGDKIGVDYTLILGDTEISNSTVSIKNMKTKEQISIKQEELEKWLKEIL
jgi:histidyl-tRNA synthetase